MNIYHEINVCADTRPLVLAIGFFDGVHRGHREILRALARARSPGYRAGVLTFGNHPASFLRPGHVPPLITTLEERVNLLARTDIDALYLLPFDERIAHLSGQRFLEEMLVERLGICALVFGENFRFGAQRSGDADLVRDVLGTRGIDVLPVPALCDAGGRISSTRIRTVIAAGDLAVADALLGEAYTLRGRVVLGEGRGHDLGFPTANITVPAEKVLPKAGVYTIIGRYAGCDYRGLVSIGNKPTFNGTTEVIEAWLLDFQETIYGEELSLRDFRFIREQRRFESVEELLLQMREDASHVAFPSFS
jgi:riboflavin kinase / FMN adenylyltransferase